MNRKEKISLLKGIVNGTRSINEVMPGQVRLWQVRDGIYTLQGGNLKLTKQEFLEFNAKQGKHTIHFIGGDIDHLIPIDHSEKDAMF